MAEGGVAVSGRCGGMKEEDGGGGKILSLTVGKVEGRQNAGLGGKRVTPPIVAPTTRNNRRNEYSL